MEDRELLELIGTIIEDETNISNASSELLDIIYKEIEERICNS